MPLLDTDQPRTTFFVMRHAPTEWNVSGRIQGQADSRLTSTGQAWATRWGKQMTPVGLDAIVTSGIGRANATARHMNTALQLPVTTAEGLQEMNWGQWTGGIHARIKVEAAQEYANQCAQGWHFRPPGGESQLEVLERALAALKWIATAHPGQKLLVITHEGVLKCLIYHLVIRDGCGHQPSRMAPYHVHHVVGSEAQLVLERMNALDLNPGQIA
jgi:broad specificity phosphatase PhoE